MSNRRGKTRNSDRFYFLGLQNHCGHWLYPQYKRHLILGEKVMTNLDGIIKSRSITLLTKICIVKSLFLFVCLFFPVVMNGCESCHKEGWKPKNWWFWTVVLKKTLESLLDYKEIKPVNHKKKKKKNQPWLFIGRTDAEAETPMLWSPDVKSWLIGKDPDARKVWRQMRRGWQRMRWLNSITTSMGMNLS